ncbi:decaprenyl-phosphate phosphoribosyltransferase [Candidatus Gracilibacteria bacterium]|nr:decaprenyl-phosphate phosphoribosyltransferase [Candidatus Gracilibacteria bacterium]
MKAWLHLLRPSNWLKNFLIFIPLIFSFNVLRPEQVWLACQAFLAFSAIASTIYVVNDIVDCERDRQHPTKKHRPIAAGLISPSRAVFAVLILLLISMLISINISPAFCLIIGGYFLLNLAYSLALKHVVLVDILIVASCYLLRVYAGAKAIGVPTTSWLLFITFFLALFIIAGKRYSELSHNYGSSRPVLAEYTTEFLSTIMNMSATGVIVFYALYTSTKFYLFGYSIIFIIFLLFRILYWTQVKKTSEEPEKLFIKDKWLLVTIVLWGITALITLYFPELVS